MFPASPGLPPSFCKAGQTALPEVVVPLKWNGRSLIGTFFPTSSSIGVALLSLSWASFSIDVVVTTDAEMIGIIATKINIKTTENLGNLLELIIYLLHCSLINLTLPASR